MEPKLFAACVARLHPLQAIYITFASGANGIAGLSRLLRLKQNHASIRIDQQQEMLLQCVVQSGAWERVSRTVMVYGLMHVHTDLLEPMARDVESVATDEHFAKRLFTSSKQKQHTVATDILGSVLNQNILDEVESFGARIDGKLSEIDGIPAILFTLFNKETGDKLVTLAIDGFSGRYAINGEWGEERFSSAQGVRERIYSVLTDCLDSLTA